MGTILGEALATPTGQSCHSLCELKQLKKMIEHFCEVRFLSFFQIAFLSPVTGANQPSCRYLRCHQALWMSSVLGSDCERKLVWLVSIYQCHSGSRGITARVSIGVCQLVSLTGIFGLWGLHSLTLTLYLPHFPHLCLSLTRACVSASACVCVNVYCQCKPPDSPGMLVEFRLFFQVTVVCALRGVSVNSYPWSGDKHTCTASRTYAGLIVCLLAPLTRRIGPQLVSLYATPAAWRWQSLSTCYHGRHPSIELEGDSWSARFNLTPGPTVHETYRRW